MKISRFLIISAFAAGFLSSCEKSGSAPETGEPQTGAAVLVPMTIGISMGEESRVHIYDGVRVGWDTTDRISLFGPQAVNSEFKALSVSGSSAVFSGMAEASGPYVALSPYDAAATLVCGEVSARIPCIQRAGSHNLDSLALLSVASSASLSSNLQMKNAVSLIKVRFDAAGYTSIKITANDGSPLAGGVRVNPSTGVITSVSDTVSSVTLVPKDEVFPVGDYYIAVIPGNKSGITATLTRSSDKRKSEKTSGNTLAATRGGIISIGAFGSDRMEWKYLIDSYQDLKDYASDVINWDEFGETVQLRADIDMKMEPWAPVNDSYDGEFQGNGHCIYNISIKSSRYQHLGFFGKYFKDVRNVIFGSKDGRTYDGNSVIENSYNADGDSWAYTAPITFSNGIIENVENFIPVTVTKNCTHKSRTSGISAWTERDGVEIIGCVNHADITLQASSGSDKNVNVSGILSGINSNNVVIRDCVNYGTITSSSIYTKGIAGIVGLNYSASLTPLVENCVNYGDVKLLYTNTQNDFICVGGIMGRSNSKDGNDPFRIRKCTNYGNIYAEGVHQQGVGGIAGRADGAEITECVNYGGVTIDHSKNATGRYQAMGGILGLAAAGFGRNSVTDCVNYGKVTIRAFSCGRASTSASSDFYGVSAAGIVGCAESLDRLRGNRNYGDIDAENGYKAKNTEALRATLFVGGVLGYDKGKIGVFGPNITGKDVKISARTTAATASLAVVRVGGIAGYLENSTMISGSASSDITASNANAAALLQIGSVVGFNLYGVIQYAGYGGTLNAAAATEKNVVGAGPGALACAPAGDEDTDNADGGLTDPTGEEAEWD